MQSPTSASLGNLLTDKPKAFPFAPPITKSSSNAAVSLFKKGGVKKLYNIIHDTNNPLNWFQRMKQRQMEKPILLNSNVAQIHRTIETREQAMVAKSGSGNQREVGRLAAMNDRDYYKQYSGVLNLARSNPVLIKKIREASVPDNSMESGLTKETKKAVLAEGGSEGGASEGGASEGGSEGGAAAAEGAEEAPMVGGGASSAASAPTTVVVPEAYKEFVAVQSSIPEPENTDYGRKRALGANAEGLTIVFGPVPGSKLKVLAAVALGDTLAEPEAKRKSLEYIRDVLKVEIGSRKYWNLVAYETKGLIEMPEKDYLELSEELFTRHPELKPVKHLATSKKALDEAVAKSAEMDVKQLQKFMAEASLNTVLENAMLPLKSGERNTIRDGFNFFLKELTTALTQAKVVDWPENIEIRKNLSPNSKVGDIYIGDEKLIDYVKSHLEDPNLLNTISKVKGLFEIVRNHLRDTKPPSELSLTTPRTEKEMKEFIDLEYPLLGEIFDILEKQIADSMKILSPKGSKGGRKKGVPNKKKKKTAGGAMIAAEMASGGAAAPATSAESADTSGGDEEA